MIRRPRRVLPAAAVALVLLAGCVVITIACVQTLLGQSPVVRYEQLTGLARWNELPVAVGGGAAAALGCVLVFLAVSPGRPVVVPLTGTDIDSGTTRSGLRRALADTAAGVDGVSAVRLRLRRRKVTAAVRTGRATTGGLADAVRGALDARLDEIAPVTRPRVRVKVRSSR
ncbi:DUF6286 domain-containing protein [Amycolatopsis anabasis]|uniref:DUF6286 domain-containing protein n=1 Tax=Amycolatopsis anabasis TaxID=1840409 RepID=UPI00131AB858|nr:DUF6286 domain-containing protein [Amycolatopsis anabasis]